MYYFAGLKEVIYLSKLAADCYGYLPLRYGQVLLLCFLDICANERVLLSFHKLRWCGTEQDKHCTEVYFLKNIKEPFPHLAFVSAD